MLRLCRLDLKVIYQEIMYVYMYEKEEKLLRILSVPNWNLKRKID